MTFKNKYLYKFCVTTIGLTAFLASQSQVMATKWNILFIQSDQHNVHMLGADRQVRDKEGKNPTTVQTPSLNKLAAEGIYFNKAYAAFPVCAPTRQSLITGEYPQVHGMYDNDTRYKFTEGGPNGKTPSFGHFFLKKGYNTALLGKTHTNNYSNDDDPKNPQYIGFEYRIDVAGKKGESIQKDRYEAMQKKYSKIPHNNGNALGMEKWEQKIQDEAQEICKADMEFFYAYCPDHPAWFRDGVVDYDALSYLDAYATGEHAEEYKVDNSKPFFCFVNFFLPHWHYTAPPQVDGQTFFHRYIGSPEKDTTATVPVDMPADTPGLLNWKMEHPYLGGDRKRDRTNVQNFKEKHIRWGRAKYYAGLTWLDYMIGQLIDKLDQLDDPRNPGKKLSETTIIAYTTDHGDMLGEKELWGKYLMYEGSVRVPFIIKMPGIIEPGQYSDILINHVDMIPTLAGLAGCGEDIDDNTYGKNYAKALLENDPSKGPKRIFSVLQITKANEHPREVMTRTQRFKFIRHLDIGADGFHNPVLFDMDNDPLETKNLAYEAEYSHIVDQENEAIDNFLSQFGVKPLNLKMPPNSVPRVKILSPAEGTEVCMNKEVAVDVSILEPSEVKDIEVYLNDRLVTNNAAAPFKYIISGFKEEWNSIKIKMINKNEQSTLCCVYVKAEEEQEPIEEPTATIVSPAEGSTFSASSNVAIDVDATTPNGIKQVVLFIDNQWIANANKEPYGFSVSGLTKGPHQLQARVTDQIDKSIWSRKVIINITEASEEKKPTIQITTPTEGTSISECNDVTIEADAHDPDGVDQIVLFIDNQWITSIKTEPYGYTVSGLNEGPHQLQLKMMDKEGSSMWSKKVNIFIKAAPSKSKHNVEIISPANQESTLIDSEITVRVEANDPNGIKDIALYVDEEWSANDDTSPYTYTVSGLREGEHKLQVKMKNLKGGFLWSDYIKIKVEK